MITIKEYLLSKRKPSVNIKANNSNLFKIVYDALKSDGLNADLNFIDVSEVTNMGGLFNCDLCTLMDEIFGDDKYKFNADISDWNVRNVKNMESMFYQCEEFNCNISKWDVSSVTDMSEMFANCCKFNVDISNWDVSNVMHMNATFSGCTAFNKPIGKWNVSKVITMNEMFGAYEGTQNAGPKAFNQDLNDWNVSNVEDMGYMFCGAKSFNKQLNKWRSKLGKVTDMSMMFAYSGFNHDISMWNVSNVTEYDDMFLECPIKEEYKPKFE